MFGLWRHQHLNTLTWIAQDVHAKRNHVGIKQCGDIKKSRLFEHAGACHRQFVPASRGTLWNVCVLVKAWPQWVQTHREHVLTTYGADCTTDPCTAFKKYVSLRAASDVFLLLSQEKSQTEKHHYGCPLRGSVHGSAKTRCECGRQSLFEERKTIWQKPIKIDADRKEKVVNQFCIFFFSSLFSKLNQVEVGGL